LIRCSQHTFLLALASLFVCWEISDSIAKTCDEDDAKVVQVEAKEFYEKGVSLKELKKLLETQAVNEAFVMVNPTQRSIHEQSVISASSSKGEGLTAKRKYSGRQVSHKSIETRYIKPIGELKIIEQQGFTFVVRRMEISVCKIKEEDIVYRVSIGPIFWSKLNREQYRSTVMAAFPQTDKISVFKASRGENLSDVAVQGGVDQARSRRNGSFYEIDVRVGLSAHIQIQHRPLTKFIRLRKKIPVSHGSELVSVMDVVDEAFKEAANALGEKLVEKLL
jgi:hypothetical protein